MTKMHTLCMIWVRHSALMEKMARLALPDAIHNWMISFFSGHSHCTKFNGNTSELKNILASVIQGSAIGPASFIVTASDLQPVHTGNALINLPTTPTSSFQQITRSRTPVRASWWTSSPGLKTITWNWTAQNLKKSSSPAEAPATNQ